MSDDIYHQAILERSRNTAHAGRLATSDATVTLDNPLCGDRITLDVKFQGATVADLTHHVRGCALCQASASVMAETVIGRTIAAAREGRVALQAFLGGAAPPAAWQAFDIFEPLRRHKSRQDCIRLPFEALEQALNQAKP